MTVNQKSESYIGFIQVKKMEERDVYKCQKYKRALLSHQKKGVRLRDCFLESMVKIYSFISGAMGSQLKRDLSRGTMC